MKISAVVNTKNAAQTLASCLQSLTWCDEIIVMDMASTDETLAIAKQYTDKIFHHEDEGYVEPARNKAISKATGDWITVLDADEQIQTSLEKKLTELSNTDIQCYFIPRKNIIFGRWIKHAGWWPDYQPRFFQPGAVKWHEKIHQPPTVSGATQKLPSTEENAIIHHNYQTIEQYLNRLNRYTSIEAKQAANQATQDPFQAFFNETFRRLFKESAYEDGLHGYHLSFLQSCFQAVIASKRWQQKDFPEDSVNLDTLKRAHKDLTYWLADYQYHQATSPLVRIYWQLRRKLKV